MYTTLPSKKVVCNSVRMDAFYNDFAYHVLKENLNVKCMYDVKAYASTISQMRQFPFYINQTNFANIINTKH